ncbi:MAG: formate transporter FocA [Alphaproteobacteria bacterium]|nr:formate transporter FocA [Alphaproteobacteria bacterium]
MSDANHPAPGGIDALLPSEIAEKAEAVGVQKTRLDAASLLGLAVLAGAFIALGAMFATTVLAGTAGTLPWGVARLLAGLVFCLGLILVVVGGAELFTGNALMVMALASRKVRLGEVLRAWAIVYLGNFVGALGTAGLVFLSGQYLAGKGVVAVVALDLALGKAVEPFDHALFLAILCNVLVCLAVWLTLGARTTADKVLAVIFPVSAFVVAGFEHSVANMYLLPLGLFIKAWAPAELWLQLGATPADFAALTWSAFVANLVPVTIGNIIGGGGLVGGVYWFIYLRQRPR